jgi:hypothetical protein
VVSNTHTHTHTHTYIYTHTHTHTYTHRYETKQLVRPDVAVKICVDHEYITISWPSSSSSAEDTYQFYKQAKKNIRLDIERIEEMAQLFLKADHRLGEAFRNHFIQSCLSMERIERAFGFPRGWDRTKVLTAQQEKNAAETEDR